jgi:hypothetical protein
MRGKGQRELMVLRMRATKEAKRKTRKIRRTRKSDKLVLF